MQGRNQFQGAVPSNMDFPTETYVSAHGQAYRDLGQAAVSAAQMEAQAKAKMYGDLAKGALGGFGAYQKSVTANKNFEAGRAMVDSPLFQKLSGLDPQDASDFGKYLDTIKGKQGVDAANDVMGSYMGNLFKYHQISQQYQHEMDLGKLRYNAAIDAANVRHPVKGTSTWGVPREEDLFGSPKTSGSSPVTGFAGSSGDVTIR